MTPNNLVPGISAYPDLERALSIKLGHSGPGCSGCQLGSLTREFSRRLKARVERDKMQRGR